MRLLWIGIFALMFASLVSLISDGRGASLIQRTWAETSSVIPETILADFQHASALYTARLFASLPQPFREKMNQKMWSAVELMTFRSLVLLHLASGSALGQLPKTEQLQRRPEPSKSIHRSLAYRLSGSPLAAHERPGCPTVIPRADWC